MIFVGLKKKHFEWLLTAVFVCGALLSCREDKTSQDTSGFPLAKKKLSEAFSLAGFQANDANPKITVNPSANQLPDSVHKPEGFHISFRNGSAHITGYDTAGALYGCLELTERLKESGQIFEKWEFSDAPKMRWRGMSLSLMKLGEYNFAVTPKEFPFFYDKPLWQKFLDFMLESRFNYLILWNGHPFDYFVKFDRFPEAQSGMTDQQIQQNHDMLNWLIAEGRKRNITIFFEFYNINTSVYFQRAHNLPRQIGKPNPLLADYTAYSIAKFAAEFPEVGLFVTPGEGLERQYSDQWINHVIFKAVKSTGKQPPIFMRGWSFDLPHARKVVKNYPNLTFVRKFNVEMIAGKQVDPENAKWAELNGNFIVNIHLAANLEPFRWNPPVYIQQIVKNNVTSGATGIHLFPRKAWRWPYGSDKGVKQYQWERDALWFKAWSRYAWKPDRDPVSEKRFWLRLLSKRFGNEVCAEQFLQSFEIGADVLPALQRLIWLGYDNHTIVTAGASLLQLENSKGIPFLDLGDTLRISEFLPAVKAGKKISGVSPVDFVREKCSLAQRSWQDVKSAAELASANLEETRRIVQDARAVYLTARFYLHKLQALTNKVQYDFLPNKEQAAELFIGELEKSVTDFKELVAVTDTTYESLSDVPAKHPARLAVTPYHWHDVLPVFEKELNIYRQYVSHVQDKNRDQPMLKGLAGIWFSEPNFLDAEKPYPSRKLDFSWKAEVNDVGRHWSVRWFGFLKAPLTGEVGFLVTADRPVTMEIGEKKLNVNGISESKTVGRLRMMKDRFYPIVIYFDHQEGEQGRLKIEWRWNGKQAAVLQSSDLWHSAVQEEKMELLVALKNGGNQP